MFVNIQQPLNLSTYTLYNLNIVPPKLIKRHVQ